MTKTQQSILDQKRIIQRKYSDRIILQTLKRKTKRINDKNLKPISWPLSTSEFVNGFELIHEIKDPQYLNTLKLPKKKRLSSWADLAVSKRTLSNKRTRANPVG
ncbi:unnamed protein product, partial [Didymodactylos carnosus]